MFGAERFKVLKHFPPTHIIFSLIPQADDIMCELQCVMREGLSVIMETEMRAAYDNLW